VTQASYTAIVLAADRGPDDPVARASGAACKSLTVINGKPMLWRVIHALQRAPSIGEIIVVGPAQNVLDADSELASALHAAGITWVAPASSPSASAGQALKIIPDDQPVLLTTADHALLQPAMVEELLQGARNLDFAVAMAAYQEVMDAYPNTRRTAIRLRPGAGYCGCNLFAVNTERGRSLIEMWQSVESQRKNPTKLVIGMLGWTAVLRYLLRQLSLTDAFARLSRALHVTVGPVLLSDPSAAIDVDSVSDLELVRSILQHNKIAEPPT